MARYRVKFSETRRIRREISFEVEAENEAQAVCRAEKELDAIDCVDVWEEGVEEEKIEEPQVERLPGESKH